MPTHINLRWTEMEDALESTQKLKDLARAYGISDPFADNNIKALQVAVALGVDLVPGRTGPDARDRIGNEYEIKTVDLDKTNHGFSTNHHLTTDTIDRFAARTFIFATYKSSTLVEAFIVTANDLAPIFTKWRQMLRGRTHLNNPKIPIDYIRDVGLVGYMKDVAPPWAESTTEDVIAA